MVADKINLLDKIDIYIWVAIGLVGGLFDRCTGGKYGANLIRRKITRDIRKADPDLSEAEIESVLQELL